jgi:hypothetical protein
VKLSVLSHQNMWNGQQARELMHHVIELIFEGVSGKQICVTFKSPNLDIFSCTVLEHQRYSKFLRIIKVYGFKLRLRYVT